jgi:hypothetical protein
MNLVLKLRRTEQLVASDADLILRSAFRMKERDMELYFQELVSEGIVECLIKDGKHYYSAVNGPSLYSAIQERVLTNLMEDQENDQG